MALDEILRALSPLGPTATVLIDGRSGSGKSTIAADLHHAWCGSTLVHLDSIYPGWDGLREATEHVATELLAPRALGRAGRWREWDWAADRPATWHGVPPGGRLIVEGTGVLTARSRALVDLAVWLDADDSLRRDRALARDGDTYRPHWQRWADQEEEFLASEKPRECADLVLRTVRIPQKPSTSETP